MTKLICNKINKLLLILLLSTNITIVILYAWYAQTALHDSTQSETLSNKQKIAEWEISHHNAEIVMDHIPEYNHMLPTFPEGNDSFPNTQ